MKIIKRNAVFAGLALILITIIFFCFSQSVYSQGRKGFANPDKESMDKLESEYIEQVAELMKEYGCEYGGITMTEVYETDGSRSYKVLIHHRNLSFFSREELAELEKRLTEFSEAFQNAEFTYGFSYLS